MLSRVAVLTVCTLALVACGGSGDGSPPQAATSADVVMREATVSAKASSASGGATEVNALLAQGAGLNADELAVAAGAARTQWPVAVAKALTPVTVYRFYNQVTSAHFYTSSAAERDNVQATLPFMTYEGSAFQASSQSGTGLSPVFRFFNQQTA